MTIREITKEDNLQIEQVIREVLTSYGANKEGFAFADPELLDMFEAYKAPKSAYFILEEKGQIYGGAGIAPLAESGLNYCELQKMYFAKEIRGKGFGKKMMKRCLDFARKTAYTHCYLETIPEMTEAQKLYRSFGFEYIDKRLGATGHSACPVFMLKHLKDPI